MIRNILGSIVALAGAAAAVLSPFRDWYDGRLGRHYRVADLFNGISARRAPGPLASIWLPFLFARRRDRWWVWCCDRGCWSPARA